MGPRCSPLRFQVDPLSPQPQRDPQYVLIVLGIAFVIVAVLLLVSLGHREQRGLGGLNGVHGADVPERGPPGPWLAWIGLPFLAWPLGIVFLIGGLWWALRKNSPR